tara:strand:- start:498 stop:2279 length:1782 start_codon:yes stop_codon:yes gene_type:complete
MPETNNATLLDELKDETFSIFRILAGDWPVLVETIATDINFCTQGMSNSECSGANFQIEHFPNWRGDHETDDFQYILQSNMTFNVFIISNSVEETVPQTMSVENLSASYSDGVTDLTWDYPTESEMNHSIMIYSHDSPATRENWDSMPKTIVSSSVLAGTTNYQIDHSGTSVEREIYYSVTLLYPTSEDTRFLGSNTLTSPVWEDNVAPLFIGELSATFDTETDKTTIDWEEGVQDDDLTINIYRSNMAPESIDSNTLVATVDAAQSSYEIEVPFGEHRQSWYAISLQDSQGNEVMELTESSPVSDPVIESTISTTTVSGIDTERYADGTVVISWDDNTNNPTALAKIWRSVSGPIDSLDDVEELGITNLSNEQFTHNPLNAQDEAWYAVTIVAAWGSEQNPWHDERLFSGENSLSQPLRETDEEIEEIMVNFTSSVMTTTGQRANLSDGAMISLGTMHEGDMIVISTSSPVSNISCQDVDGEGTSLYSQSDWALSFSANQSEEKCLGLIVDGADEIGFILTWDYVETVVDNDEEERDQDEERDDDENRDGTKSRDGDGMETVATVILTIIILALLVYLLVMMRTPEYTEEEE